MESLRFTRLRQLAQTGSFSVALTAYLPIPDETAFPPDPKKLGKIQEKAEKALSKGIEIKEAESFRTNLDHVLGIVSEIKHTQGTWIIAVTPTIAEAIFVPFLFEESIEVSKKLDVARAVYAFYRVPYYFIAVVSENVARFYECIGEHLFSVELPSSLVEALRQLQKARQQLQGSSSAIDSHYQQMFGEMARAAFQMALVKYEDELAAILSHYATAEGYPIILAGDDRLVQAVADKTGLSEGLTKISGIYELIPPEQLLQHVRQHTEYHRALLLQAYKPFLEYSDPQTPQEIWELLEDTHYTGRPILFVAEGYAFPAKDLLGNKRGLLTQDGVDLIIEKVRARQGEVLFLPADQLPSPLLLLIP
jgi:hypothetical protein